MADAPPAPVIIAAAIILRSDGQTLLVRKRGTDAFMQPGGKIDHGETAADALRRELDEELGLGVPTGDASPIGRFEAEAAHEPGRRLHATLFLVRTDAAVHPAAEIEQAIWIDPAAPGDLVLAPLTRDTALPLARRFNRDAPA